MGAALVKRALTRPVNGRAFRVLVAMCITAKDTDDPAVYYGGWDYLALALGYETYSRNAHEQVRRAVAELVAAGVIKPDGYAPGGNRRYVLRL